MNIKRPATYTFSYFLFLFLFFGSSFPSLYSQNTVTGRVIDTQKKPVYSVAVSIEGTTIGEYTNEQGEFLLTNVPAGNRTVTVSGLGLKTVKAKINVLSGKTTVIPDIEISNSLELDEVVVTGKSEARQKQEQAYAVSVLDLKKSYNTVAPLSKMLSNVSSVRIREDGGVGSNYNFSLNGFSGNQVKFFLDGIPMDNFGSSFNLSNISVNMAERIEVYKGVLPVSLGADALGGAVNIISRKDANYLDASYSIGSFNTHRISLNGAYTDLKTGFTVRANTFFNYSDNDYKVFVPIKDLESGKTIEEKWVKRFHDDYKSMGIKFETGITNKSYADYLLAGIILSKNDKDVQTGAVMDAVYGGVRAKSESMIPSIRYKKEDLFVEGLSASLYGAYSMVNSFSIDTLARNYNWLGEWAEKKAKGERAYTDSKIKNREWLANANLSYMIDNHQSVTLNHVFSSLNRKIHDAVDPENESNKIPQKLTKNITGLGWQIKYDRWNANVFGKMYTTNSSTYKIENQYLSNQSLEKLTDSKTNFGYGAAFTYFILPKLQGKLSYEKAYRLPESSEMFGDGLVQQRNPDLKPESSNNANLGFIFEQIFKEHTLYVETNLIYRDTKDFILKDVSTATAVTSYKNMGKVRTKGVEGGLKYQFKRLLQAGVNFTYQDIKDVQKYEKREGSYVGNDVFENVNYKRRIPNIPYIFGHGDIGLRFQDIAMKDTELSLDYSLNYVWKYYLSFPGMGAKASKKVIPEQTSHDISLGYTMQGGKYSVIVECTNFTDTKLYDNYRLQKPGRAFNLKLRYFLK
ncbi:TonB-dependent receptor [Prevotella sp. 10(H)]|uniref:TonB-dependent receptor n=1 Tax=Prevotella sp. 10(H) TaxID=1158294 RepID=UPI00068D0938|nr:TonB-dependent receptor [Prevotella sp. 10(H)]